MLLNAGLSAAPLSLEVDDGQAGGGYGGGNYGRRAGGWLAWAPRGMGGQDGCASWDRRALPLSAAANVALFVLALAGWARATGTGGQNGAGTGGAAQAAQAKPTVLLVSTDGFRWDYYERAPKDGAFERMRRMGTRAEYMAPVFPSKTFPNHYSMATGLFPAWHGVVANRFYDPDLDVHFDMRNKDKRLWLGEPIWESVAREGKKAASYFWPGDEVKRSFWKCEPARCPPYNGSVPYEERVDTVLGWLDLPDDDRPQFVALYFEETDSIGHHYGPDSADVTEAVARLDRVFARLLSGLDARGLLTGPDAVHIIHVGDHGMAGVGGTCKYMAVDELARAFNTSWVEGGRLGGNHPTLAVRPPHDEVAAAYDALREGLPHDRAQVYKESELRGPPFHYANPPGLHRRIAPVQVIAADGYILGPAGDEPICGVHGYDNRQVDMRTVFLGTGPRFPAGAVIPGFANVELYALIAEILDLEDPAPTNGTAGFARGVLLNVTA